MHKFLAIIFFGWIMPLISFEYRDLKIINESNLEVIAKYKQHKTVLLGIPMLVDYQREVKPNEQIIAKVLVDKEGSANIMLKYFKDNQQVKEEQINIPKGAYIHIAKKKAKTMTTD